MAVYELSYAPECFKIFEYFLEYEFQFGCHMVMNMNFFNEKFVKRSYVSIC